MVIQKPQHLKIKIHKIKDLPILINLVNSERLVKSILTVSFNIRNKIQLPVKINNNNNNQRENVTTSEIKFAIE